MVDNWCRTRRKELITMIKNAALLLVLLLMTKLYAEAPKYDFDNPEYVKNYDGDTITFNLKDVHPLLGKDISVRVYGIDAPELKTTNACEKERAIKAKDLVYTSLKNAKTIQLKDCARDKYFRMLCKVFFDNKSLSAELLKQGLAYEYYGKTKEEIDWCLSEPNKTNN